MRRISPGTSVAFGAAGLASFLAAQVLACRIIDPIPYPFPHPPAPLPQMMPVTTRSHSAEIAVKDRSAEVRVRAVFRNPNACRIEGTYWFPLPPNAAVKKFAMKVNGKDVQAELLDADRARKTYEDIVRKLKDPALLEWIGAGMLKCRVFPMEPGADTEVALEYTQLLPEDGGLASLAYPLRSARAAEGKIGELTLRIDIESSVPLKTVYSPTHAFEIVRRDETHARLTLEQKDADPERDVEVVFSRDAGDVGLSVLSHKPRGEDGYFMLTVTPKVEVDRRRVIAKDVILVLDTSGSMKTDNKIAQARAALKFCASSLNERDRFNIVAFSGEVRTFRKEMVERSASSVEEAAKYADSLEALGGTALHDALAEALKMAGDSRNVPMILLLTDGNPTVGERDVEAILKDARQRNRNRCRVFVFGVGYDVNTRLLDTLAEDARAAREYVRPGEDIEVKVSGLFTKLSNPVMSDLRLELDGPDASDMYPRELPDLFHGGQITVLGRFKRPGEFAASLRGRVGDDERRFRYDVAFRDTGANEWLPRLWAIRKVAFLLDEIRLRGENKELTDEVTRLGKLHGILTPYTSFLIVEEDSAVTPAARQELRGMARGAPGRFLSVREGGGAVADSAGIAVAKGGFGTGYAPTAPARAQVLGLNTAAGESGEMQRMLADAAREAVRQVGGRTFYVKADGLWVQSDCLDADESRVTRIALWSDGFFELIRKHPDIGKVLVETRKAVVLAEGRIYRIE